MNFTLKMVRATETGHIGVEDAIKAIAEAQGKAEVAVVFTFEKSLTPRDNAKILSYLILTNEAAGHGNRESFDKFCSVVAEVHRQSRRVQRNVGYGLFITE